LTSGTGTRLHPVPRAHGRRGYDGKVTDLFHHGAADLAEDAHRLLLELDRDVPGVAAVTADCRPPLDVLETSTSIEVVIDVPGVPPESLRVAIRRNTLLIVGAKLGGPIDPNARFHLAERSYGRFARAVRLGGAFDASRARAMSGAGQLRVVLPLVEDRRGRVLRVPVERA
jgi:HSP20 family protein